MESLIYINWLEHFAVCFIDIALYVEDLVEVFGLFPVAHCFYSIYFAASLDGIQLIYFCKYNQNADRTKGNDDDTDDNQDDDIDEDEVEDEEDADDDDDDEDEGQDDGTRLFRYRTKNAGEDKLD